MMTSIYPLQGSVQHYDWGGQQFLPELMNRPLGQQPWAELWLGAHPKSPSLVDGNSLTAMISDNCELLLGPTVAERFATLPFLLKVLDVEKMLSIQVHPNLAQARDGFIWENEEGIALDAANRNYRDANHKPELMVALSDFWLLHGFRTVASATACLRQHPEMIELAERLTMLGMEQFYREIMLEPDERLFTSMADLAVRLRAEPAPDIHSPDHWFLKAVDSNHGQLEPGMLSIYLLNLVYLSPGQGIFQDAGIPHAYLKGQNIELMANSDNVLRAGLTPKHIDVPELLKIIRTEAVEPEILAGVDLGDNRVGYPAAVDDFALEKIAVQHSRTMYRAARPQPMVVLVMEGAVTINDEYTLGRGESVFVAANTLLTLDIAAGSQLFVASSNLQDC